MAVETTAKTAAQATRECKSADANIV